MSLLVKAPVDAKIAEHAALTATHGVPGTIAGLADIPTGIEIAVTWFSDYSGDLNPRVTVLFPWSAPTKLADPADLPGNTGYGAAWSPNGEFLAVAHNIDPRITIYQRSGITFTKLADPADLPASTGRGAAWSPNGEFLAVAHSSSPYITIYQRSGVTFTKLADPADLPASTGRGAALSPNGEFLAVAHSDSPWITIYQTPSTLAESGMALVKGVLREGD